MAIVRTLELHRCANVKTKDEEKKAPAMSIPDVFVVVFPGVVGVVRRRG